MSINRVILSGNLTRDPELRTTQSGMSVLSFGIAVNDRRKNGQTGDWEDYANFFDCTMFGSRAQSISQYISKGQRVMIDGKLRYSSWEKDGQRRSKVDVIIDDLDFSGSRSNANSAASDAGIDAYSAPTTPVVDTNSSIYDEDIPF